MVQSILKTKQRLILAKSGQFEKLLDMNNSNILYANDEHKLLILSEWGQLAHAIRTYANFVFTYTNGEFTTLKNRYTTRGAACTALIDVFPYIKPYLSLDGKIRITNDDRIILALSGVE